MYGILELVYVDRGQCKFHTLMSHWHILRIGLSSVRKNIPDGQFFFHVTEFVH